MKLLSKWSLRNHKKLHLCVGIATAAAVIAIKKLVNNNLQQNILQKFVPLSNLRFIKLSCKSGHFRSIFPKACGRSSPSTSTSRSQIRDYFNLTSCHHQRQPQINNTTPPQQRQPPQWHSSILSL
jgi:hypothetical protein